MTIIYVAENNCERLAVTLKNNGLVRVQNFEDLSEDKNAIYEVNPVETFIGKILCCEMTEFSGPDREIFDGNTILLEIGEETN